MKKFLGIFIIGLLWSNIGVADYMKLSPIGKMYEDCTMYMKLIRSDSLLNNEENLRAILCNQYFEGLDGGVLYQTVITNSNLSQKDKKRLNTENVLGSCMRDPKFNTGGQNGKLNFIKAFIRYVEDNPKKIKEIENKDIPDFYPVVRVVDAALREKYPC